VQIFKDGEGLLKRMAVVDQGRHEVLRVEPSVFGCELLSAILQQVHEFVFSVQVFQIERDAHPEGGGGAKIGIKRERLSHTAPPADRWRRRWSGRPNPASRF